MIAGLDPLYVKTREQGGSFLVKHDSARCWRGLGYRAVNSW